MAEKDEQEMLMLISEMKDWINTQPHLPKDTEDDMLRRFLHSCYFDIEKAKVAFDLFFTIRSSSPDLLDNRDPKSAPMQKIMSIINLAQLEIAGKKNLWIWQLNDPGLEQFDFILDAKLFFLSSDAWMMSDIRLQEEDTVLFDVKDVNLRILTKFNVSVMKKLSKYQEDAMPIRLKRVHIVNAPSYFDKIFAFVKPFMKKERQEMICFHSSMESLYEHISRDDLPADFGGNRAPMDQLMKRTLELINNNRDRLLDPKLWRAVGKKSKKSEKNDKKIVEDLSFRSLAID